VLEIKEQIAERKREIVSEIQKVRQQRYSESRADSVSQPRLPYQIRKKSTAKLISNRHPSPPVEDQRKEEPSFEMQKRIN